MTNNADSMRFLSGDEALAQGAYEEGLSVACSYPGTPATEVLEYLARFDDVDCQWSVNEKVAYEVAAAASVAGARALYSSKHVGLNVAMDPLMTSAYIGVNGGFIVVTADDPGLHSSQNEQDNRLIAHMAKIPLLEPSSPADAYAFARTAFSLSESFDTPVMLRLTTRVSHTKENIVIGKRNPLAKKEFKINAAKYVMVPGNAYRRHIALEQRLVKLAEYADNSPLNRIELNDTKLGIVAGGVAYLYAKEMYPDASFLRLGMSYPFPDGKIREFAAKVKELVVIEELEPFLEEHIRMLGIKLRAKHPSFRVGELRPELIPAVVNGEEKKEEPAGTRKPVLCPGCQHRAVFSTLKKLKLTVAGDIGCYTLGALPPLSALHSCLCMGSGVTFFEGLGRVLGKNVVGVIGDSTFVHSGITGLINAAYNKAKGLLIILDNSTTAMTGSQPNPSTGVTIKGEKTKQLRLEDLCKVAGADNVDVIDPYNFDELEAIIKKRVNEEALSVLITRFPCQIVERRRYEPPQFDAEKCKKCYRCLNIDCPALVKSADGTIAINTVYCTGCSLCVATCKFGALKKKP
jgi:indolepyruvate ferredoxin oxidoreductase alpha subunit